MRTYRSLWDLYTAILQLDSTTATTQMYSGADLLDSMERYSGTCDLYISKPESTAHYSKFHSCSQHPQWHYHRKPSNKMIMLGLTELIAPLRDFPLTQYFLKKRRDHPFPQRMLAQDELLRSYFG